jgi:predicted metal-dependent phosphoesterase TrpH
MLLCDFHIHTTYSDGSVELRKVIDLYGQAGFDVIAITDRNKWNNTLGKLAHRFKFSVTDDNWRVYYPLKEEA